MKKLVLLLSIICIIFSFTACDSERPDRVIYRDGTEYNMPDKIDRIISTSPSNTEILVGLGLGDNLIAVDTYSTVIEGYSPDAAVIDFYAPDAEAIIALEPDIIIANVHNVYGNEEPFSLIEQSGINVVYVGDCLSFDDIYNDIAFIANVTDEVKTGKKLVNDMKDTIEDLTKKGQSVTDKKTLYFEIDSYGGYYSFGNDTFLQEILNVVGADNIFSDISGITNASEESIIERNPDVIMTNADYIPTIVNDIKARNAWSEITAVKNHEVYLLTGGATNRPTHNVVDAIEEIGHILYPDIF